MNPYKFVKRVVRWLVKSIQYSLFLWNDTDYDWAYILLLLRYKLSRTRKHIVKHNIIEDAPIVSASISRVEELIDRVVKDDYCSDEYDACFAKHCKGNSKDVLTELCTNTLDASWHDEFRAISDKRSKQLEADWAELFDLLQRDLRSYWD
jgi:hypothetical protein